MSSCNNVVPCSTGEDLLLYGSYILGKPEWTLLLFLTVLCRLEKEEYILESELKMFFLLTREVKIGSITLGQGLEESIVSV